MKKLFAFLFVLVALGVHAQQLQTQSAPQPANVKYANGVSPGYALTKGTGLSLNISAGTTQCVDQLAEYAGGSLTMTDATVNYIYLDPAQDCAPVVNTTGFLQGTVWLAKITTSGGIITSITDDVRTPFAVSKVAISGSGGTGGGTNNQGTVALTGCGVSYTGSGLVFNVSSCTYLIAGTQYVSAAATLTLGAADATNERFDVIAVDSSGTAVVVPGTPSGSPAEPSVDPATQLRLIAVDIPALATTPAGITTTDLYLENTEWTCAVSAHLDCASTSNPFAGSKDIEATSAVAGNNATLTKPSGTVDLSTYATLILYVRSKAAWPNSKSLSIFWLNGSTVVGASVSLKTGQFGFNSTNTSAYQQVVIPLGVFATGTSAVNKLKISVAGGGGSIGFYIDNVSIQAGTIPSSSGPQSITFVTNSPLTGAGTVPLGGTVNLSCPTCNISGANVIASGTPTAGQMAQWTDATHVKGVTMSQDCTINTSGVITCTKTNNVSFAPSATTDTTSASNISSGTLGLARGGTNADLSATGGTSQFLKQAASGAAITVVRPACADLSDSSGGCSMSTTAGGDLSGTLPSPTVAKVNGIAYSGTAAAHSVEVITTANTTATAKVVPDCTDTGGNHLNYTQSTDSFSCGSTELTSTSSVTGSPSSGNLTKFSGASTITNGDLSGDVTTSGTLATTVAKINGTSFAGTNGHIVSFGASNVPADSGLVAANQVNASSPGAGIARFAGSTQTVTSAELSGDVTTSGSNATTLGSNFKIRGIPFVVGAPGGAALTAGANDVDYVTVPFACTIAGYNLLVDAGTVTVKFWKIATGTAIPTSSNSISTSGVSISSGTAIHSTTTSDFTSTTVTANDIMAMKVTAVATAAYVQGVLQCNQ